MGNYSLRSTFPQIIAFLNSSCATCTENQDHNQNWLLFSSLCMASKDDVQAQNLILYGYHDTEFKVEKSGLRKQSKDESWEDVLSI